MYCTGIAIINMLCKALCSLVRYCNCALIPLKTQYCIRKLFLNMAPFPVLYLFLSQQLPAPPIPPPPLLLVLLPCLPDFVVFVFNSRVFSLAPPVHGVLENPPIVQTHTTGSSKYLSRPCHPSLTHPTKNSHAGEMWTNLKCSAHTHMPLDVQYKWTYTGLVYHKVNKLNFLWIVVVALNHDSF